MTLLIPLLMRLTMLFERGVPAEEAPADAMANEEELPAISVEQE